VGSRRSTIHLGQIALFFSEAGAFVCGSGLAIVPFLYGNVVSEHHRPRSKKFFTWPLDRGRRIACITRLSDI
jgi:hypothetical protein